MESTKFDLDDYRKLLKEYLITKDESALYQAEQFSRLSVQQKVSPEEIIQIHIEALQSLYPELPREISESLNLDRKSTRLNSSHVAISYADFCLKKKSASTS